MFFFSPKQQAVSFDFSTPAHFPLHVVGLSVLVKPQRAEEVGVPTLISASPQLFMH